MSHPLLGTLDGNIVRLDEQPPLPSGCRVTLTINPLDATQRCRAKVGETTGPAFKVPDEALEPLNEERTARVGPMKLLLDTCAFLWLATEPKRLSKAAAEALDEDTNERWLSDAGAVGNQPEAFGRQASAARTAARLDSQANRILRSSVPAHRLRSHLPIR